MKALHALALAAVLLAATAVLAQAQPRYGCDSPESRQLDFWVGEWDLSYSLGGKQGRSREAWTTQWEIDYRRVK